MKIPKHLAVLIVTTLVAAPVIAGEWDVTGFVGVDTRAFLHSGADAEQDRRADVSLAFQPELYGHSDDGRKRLSVVGFARLDAQDSERSHFDIREALFGFEQATWDVNLGIGKVFWGVAESRHLVDVINQTDLVEDIGQGEKLGQPMLNLNLQREFGRFGIFVLPYFRERTFPGPDGRFRSPLPVDTAHPVYESSQQDRHVDFALRYSHYFGDIDIGTYVFQGTAREPWFRVTADGERLQPVYDQMTQVGIDLQYTHEAWLWKLEAIGRDSRTGAFAATVGGLEYTLYGIRDSATDIGLILEYLYDGRGDTAPPTAFDNDLFLGTRLALNDTSDTSLLAGIAVDRETRELLLNIKAERRFGENLSALLRVRSFLNSGPGDDLYALARDDYVQLSLSWYY